MNPHIQQRVDGVAALHIRSKVATTAFYALIGKDQPVQEVRYQVIAKGESAYHIVERATGLTKGFRFSWKAAVNLAQVLEARADGIKVSLSGDRK